MNRLVFLFFLLQVISCHAIASDRHDSFSDFLSNFPDARQYDFQWDGQLMLRVQYAGNVHPTRKEIPQEYLEKFFFFNKTCLDKEKYKYYYGGKYVYEDGVVTIVYRTQKDFVTRFGKGLTEAFATTYHDEDGWIDDQLFICPRSAEHRTAIYIEDMKNYVGNHDRVTISVKDTIITHCDKNSVYGTLLSYRAFVRAKTNTLYTEGAYDGYVIEDLVFPRKAFRISDNRDAIGQPYISVSHKRINEAYARLQENPVDSFAQAAYFEAFPDNWDDLVDLYQFRLEPNYDMTMLCNSEQHLKAFFKLDKIGRRNYINKIIDIVDEGEDSPKARHLWNAFREEIALLLSDYEKEGGNCEKLFSCLSSRSTAYQFGFWRFYFGWYYEQTKPYELQNLSRRFSWQYPALLSTMKDAYYYYSGKLYDRNTGPRILF